MTDDRVKSIDVINVCCVGFSIKIALQIDEDSEVMYCARATCYAVNSADCTLKVNLDCSSSCFVYKQKHLLATQEF